MRIGETSQVEAVLSNKWNKKFLDDKLTVTVNWLKLFFEKLKLTCVQGGSPS